MHAPVFVVASMLPEWALWLIAALVVMLLTRALRSLGIPWGMAAPMGVIAAFFALIALSTTADLALFFFT